jgi:hypothetical protein
LLSLLKWTTLCGGERSWRGWERLTKILAGALGYATHWGGYPDELVTIRMMRLTDWADGLIGARGAWQTTGDLSATKTIPNCLLAEHLQSTPGFWTRLG